MAIEATFIPGTEPLFSEGEYRYKVLEGGRGSGKSWSVARSLLLRGAKRPLRYLCCRELQKSLSESVHQLLRDQVYALGLGGYYRVLRDEIQGPGDTRFTYAGLRNDPQAVKSTEGLDGAWVEEGQSISQESFEILDPTVRKPGSEIIVTYNARFETDYIHAAFADPDKRPPRSWYKVLNYMDNPWFSEANREQMEHMKRTNPLLYEHVWLGKCVPNLTNALWTLESIDAHRLRADTAMDQARVVVAVDPAVTANQRSDETGIVVASASRMVPRHFYVLADVSGRYSPEAWARKALSVYDSFSADAITFEVNQGGDMVKETLQNVCRSEGRSIPRLIPVRASRGKVVRAEPIAALYSQGLVHHCGAFPELERQMLTFNPADPRQKSPDRMDALVWAMTELSAGRVPMKIAPGISKLFARA